MITPAESIERFPQLAPLFQLSTPENGWRFQAMLDGAGHVGVVIGFHVWPDGHVDTLTIHGEDQAEAARDNLSDDRVWKCTGTLAVVLDELLALPQPGEPNAPRLVLPRTVDVQRRPPGLR